MKRGALAVLAASLVASTAMAQHWDDHGRGHDHDHRPPPHAAYRWSRGERLHDHYHGHVYEVRDYRSHRLRPPPRGYHWVRDDTGNFLLAAVATGVIADIVLNH
jgi:Ni/Co efflux regulator RcnB